MTYSLEIIRHRPRHDGAAGDQGSPGFSHIVPEWRTGRRIAPIRVRVQLPFKTA
jgi:hypothetical protein